MYRSPTGRSVCSCAAPPADGHALTIASTWRCRSRIEAATARAAADAPGACRAPPTPALLADDGAGGAGGVSTGRFGCAEAWLPAGTAVVATRRARTSAGASEESFVGDATGAASPPTGGCATPGEAPPV